MLIQDSRRAPRDRIFLGINLIAEVDRRSILLLRKRAPSAFRHFTLIRYALDGAEMSEMSDLYLNRFLPLALNVNRDRLKCG